MTRPGISNAQGHEGQLSCITAAHSPPITTMTACCAVFTWLSDFISHRYSNDLAISVSVSKSIHWLH